MVVAVFSDTSEPPFNSATTHACRQSRQRDEESTNSPLPPDRGPSPGQKRFQKKGKLSLNWLPSLICELAGFMEVRAYSHICTSMSKTQKSSLIKNAKQPKQNQASFAPTSRIKNFGQALETLEKQAFGCGHEPKLYSVSFLCTMVVPYSAIRCRGQH